MSPENKSDCTFYPLSTSNFLFKRLLRTQEFKKNSLKGTSHTNSDSDWGNESFIQQNSPKNISRNISEGTLIRGQGTKLRTKNLEIWKP
jgi:hypothetical protein